MLRSGTGAPPATAARTRPAGRCCPADTGDACGWRLLPAGLPMRPPRASPAARTARATTAAASSAAAARDSAATERSTRRPGMYSERCAATTSPAGTAPAAPPARPASHPTCVRSRMKSAGTVRTVRRPASACPTAPAVRAGRCAATSAAMRSARPAVTASAATARASPVRAARPRTRAGRAAVRMDTPAPIRPPARAFRARRGRTPARSRRGGPSPAVRRGRTVAWTVVARPGSSAASRRERRRWAASAPSSASADGGLPKPQLARARRRPGSGSRPARSASAHRAHRDRADRSATPRARRPHRGADANGTFRPTGPSEAPPLHGVKRVLTPHQAGGRHESDAHARHAASRRRRIVGRHEHDFRGCPVPHHAAGCDGSGMPDGDISGERGLLPEEILMRIVRKRQRWQSAALLVAVPIVLGLAANRTATADNLLKPILPDVSAYVADPESALVLGKALFFDEQAGSDGTACASCHFSAGADSRIQNQLSPGLEGHHQRSARRWQVRLGAVGHLGGRPG